MAATRAQFGSHPAPARAIADLVPWRARDLGACPWEGFWAFNPSIVAIPDQHDGRGPRLVASIRCANYHLPGSTVSPIGKARPIQNRTILMDLDRETLGQRGEAHELDTSGIAMPQKSQFGYEDLRLVWTPAGLCAIANSLVHSPGNTLEIVVLGLVESVDAGMGIEGQWSAVSALPLRGSWSRDHQKNWTPFVGSDSLRLLFSITQGGVHALTGRVVDLHAPPRGLGELAGPARPKAPGPREFASGAQQIIMGPRKGELPPQRAHLTLRGGTQLIPIDVGNVADGPGYVGLCHGCYVSTVKYYWHHVYAVDREGHLIGLSPALKLSPAHGIEFAAGLAIDPDDPDRALVSFGIEDDSAWIAETSLRGLVNLLEPIA